MVNKFRLLTTLALSALTLQAYAVDDSAIKTVWAYKGNVAPERWAELSPAFAVCAAGKEQSPIDIPKEVSKAKNALSIRYLPAPMRIVEDGTTEVTLGSTQAIINTGHGIQLNFPKNTKETITVDGKKYQLLQFHIHTPSENTLNGQDFPLEIHFVHQGDDGELAVIGVFAKDGDANPIMEKIVNHLPKEHGKEETIKNEYMNPKSLLPNQRDHYRFNGSLTTPPCAEGVRWIVMAEPIVVSSAEITKLREAVGGPNARPIQPFNDRQISFSPGKM